MAVALAGPHERCIMTSIPGEKFPTWPPATAARLTPHTASHLEADEKVPMTMNIVLAAHDRTFASQIVVIIKKVSDYFMEL